MEHELLRMWEKAQWTIMKSSLMKNPGLEVTASWNIDLEEGTNLAISGECVGKCNIIAWEIKAVVTSIKEQRELLMNDLEKDIINWLIESAWDKNVLVKHLREFEKREDEYEHLLIVLKIFSLGVEAAGDTDWEITDQTELDAHRELDDLIKMLEEQTQQEKPMEWVEQSGENAKLKKSLCLSRSKKRNNRKSHLRERTFSSWDGMKYYDRESYVPQYWPNPNSHHTEYLVGSAVSLMSGADTQNVRHTPRYVCTDCGTGCTCGSATSTPHTISVTHQDNRLPLPVKKKNITLQPENVKEAGVSPVPDNSGEIVLVQVPADGEGVLVGEVSKGAQVYNAFTAWRN